MIKSCDAGSLPFQGNLRMFLEGADHFHQNIDDDSTRYFEKKVQSSFLDKVEVEIEIPNYPQFRDMNEMFFGMIDGVEKVKGGYVETRTPSIRIDNINIPELMVIRRNSQMIFERKKEPFHAKICVTGPYTLSSFFTNRDSEIFRRLGNVISHIVETNVFRDKNGRVDLVALDEPLFGILDDSLIDYGSQAREELLAAWESILEKAISKNAETLLHLHDTTDELFWEVKSLHIISSHINDPLYQMKNTKKRLESTDKFLKASLCTTQFDNLIKKRIIQTSKQEKSKIEINQEIAKAWKDINLQETDPKIFLESIGLMKKRLVEMVNNFGEERIQYAGPECGLKGFPTYECAIECLRRVSKAVRNQSL